MSAVGQESASPSLGKALATRTDVFGPQRQRRRPKSAHPASRAPRSANSYQIDRRLATSPLNQRITMPRMFSPGARPQSARRAMRGPVGAPLVQSPLIGGAGGGPVPARAGRPQSAPVVRAPVGPLGAQPGEPDGVGPTTAATPSFLEREVDRQRRKEEIARIVEERRTEYVSRQLTEREQVKSRLMAEKQREEQHQVTHKVRMRREWQRRLESSPFAVDLLAENERYEEEMSHRSTIEKKKQRQFVQRKMKVKNDVVLQALRDGLDEELDRRKKLLILEEEKKVKARRDVRKSSKRGAKDPMDNQREESRRHRENLAELARQKKELQDIKRKKLLQRLNIKYEQLPKVPTVLKAFRPVDTPPTQKKGRKPIAET